MFKKAFTMAEIMIAMSVIGVISVMVLPSVTGNTSSKQFLVSYKKAIAVLSQAVGTNKAMSGWDFAGSRDNYQTAVVDILEARTEATENTASWKISGIKGSGYIGDCAEDGYATHGQVCFNDSDTIEFMVNSASSNIKTTVYTLKDGMTTLIMLGEDFGTDDQIPCRANGQRTFTPSGSYSSAANYCLAYLDVNGSKGPNKIVSCTNGIKNGGQIRDNIAADGCKISGNHLTDVFPVLIYGDRITPATAAGIVAFNE